MCNRDVLVTFPISECIMSKSYIRGTCNCCLTNVDLFISLIFCSWRYVDCDINTVLSYNNSICVSNLLIGDFSKYALKPALSFWDFVQCNGFCIVDTCIYMFCMLTPLFRQNVCILYLIKFLRVDSVLKKDVV